MAPIICYRCFARFRPREARFKCAYHKVHDPHLGANAPLIFDGPKRRWWQRDCSHAACPRDTMLTGFRVCPRCHHDLPYHAGRSKQRIVAVVGISGSGKTLYIWGLLHQLRDQLARENDPYVTPMFEDDASYEYFQQLHANLVRHHVLPQGTQSRKQKDEGIPPVTVRCLRGQGKSVQLSNLVLYDPAGELVHSLTNIQFLRYLEHASGIIYLVEPAGAASMSERSRASEALSHVVTALRKKQQGQTNRLQRIRKTLAVVLTKADEFVFPHHDPADLLPGGGTDPTFWRKFNATRQAAFRRSSAACREILREMGHNNLLAVADHSFTRTAYFTVSSLGSALGPTGLIGTPSPIGVEHPLFWSLHHLG